jgi:hypothetical protein
MTALRSSHAVWLEWRASMLSGTSATAAGEPPDPARASQLYRIATKLIVAVQRDGLLVLTPEESALLAAEANALTERVAQEQRRPADHRDLLRAEEWLMIARALREILEATG